MKKLLFYHICHVDFFSEFIRLFEQGDLSTWRKAYDFLYPVAARAAHVLGYSREEAETIAFDSLSSLPGKLFSFKSVGRRICVHLQ